ncbi:MAG: hypothetical protein ACDS79_15290 [Enterobacteriaceae bacterium]
MLMEIGLVLGGFIVGSVMANKTADKNTEHSVKRAREDEQFHHGLAAEQAVRAAYSLGWYWTMAQNSRATDLVAGLHLHPQYGDEARHFLDTIDDHMESVQEYIDEVTTELKRDMTDEDCNGAKFYREGLEKLKALKVRLQMMLEERD